MSVTTKRRHWDAFGENSATCSKQVPYVYLYVMDSMRTWKNLVRRDAGWSARRDVDDVRCVKEACPGEVWPAFRNRERNLLAQPTDLGKQLPEHPVHAPAHQLQDQVPAWPPVSEQKRGARGEAEGPGGEPKGSR